MYFPPTNYNTNSTFNKYKGTYFNNDIDISGGHIINRNGNIYAAPNSNIYSSTNRIQFNDISNNIYFHTPLKMFYNTIEYDIGERLGKIQDIYDNKIGTMAYSNNSNNFDNIYSSGAINYLDSSGNKTNIIPIINNNTQKLTNITFSGPNTTNFTGILNFVSGQISVGAINGTAVNLNGEQTITATKKTFQNNLQLNGSLLLSAGTITVTNTQLQSIPTTATKCTNMSYSSLTNQTSFSNLLEFTGTLNGYSASNFNNAINRTYGLTSDCQSQLSTLSTDLSTATTNISTLTNKLTNVSFTTPTTFITGTTETNILKFNTSLNGITPTIFLYLSNVTSDIQQQINNISTVSLSANNIFTGLCKFTNTLQLDSSLVIKTLATSITLTGDNLTRIQYLSNVSSDVNTSITNLNSSVSTLNTKTTKMSYMSFGGVNTTTFTDNLISQTFSFTGSINNIAPTTFGYISDLTSSAQTQISNLATKVTGLSYSGTTTTIANTLSTSILTFSSTLNNISNTTFGYISDLTSSAQAQINSLKTKTDTTNVNVATLTTTVNDFALRTTEMSYSDDPTPQTNITNKIVLEEVVFTTDLNNITPTTFGYLAGVSSNIQTQLDSKTDLIPGTIIQHISAYLQINFPTRFLLCNGQSVSRTTYANLFSYIGTTYGSVDANSFSVPDFTACYLRMYSSPRTVNGVVYTPNAVGTIQQDSLEAHVHSSNLTGTYLSSSSQNGVNFTAGLSTFQRPSFPAFTGGVSTSHRTSTETRPLNHSVYFYVTC